MKPKVTRKPFKTTQDIEAASNDQLIALFKEKAHTNRDGWTFGAAADDGLRRLDKGDRAARVLAKQGFGRPKGRYGVARRVVERLASRCSTFDQLIASMEREKGADREVIDVVDGEVTFNDQARSPTVTYKTLRKYLRQARKRHLG